MDRELKSQCISKPMYFVYKRKEEKMKKQNCVSAVVSATSLPLRMVNSALSTESVFDLAQVLRLFYMVPSYYSIR